MYRLILLIICCYGGVTSAGVEPWYWRDYSDLIPIDALATGINIRGEETYLGQIITPTEHSTFKSKFNALPATITPGEKVAVGSYNTHYVNSSHNVKILCASSMEQYTWFLPTDHIPIGCKYVTVGYEDTRPCYVGKIVINKEVINGKIISGTVNRFPVMYYPYNGTERLAYDYKALFYCEN